jgi:hypothetical protein
MKVTQVKHVPWCLEITQFKASKILSEYFCDNANLETRKMPSLVAARSEA